MKKLFFYFLALLLFVNCQAQKKAQLINFRDSSCLITIDMAANGSFKELYYFQYEEQNRSIVNGDYEFVQFSPETLKIRSNGKVFAFTIDKNYSNPDEVIIIGYGLSHRKGNYSLASSSDPSDIYQILKLNGVLSSASSSCDSGGVGSTGCSTDGGAAGLGATCSVTCGAGYHSCCNDAKNECRCKPNPTKIQPIKK